MSASFASIIGGGGAEKEAKEKRGTTLSVRMLGRIMGSRVIREYVTAKYRFHHAVVLPPEQATQRLTLHICSPHAVQDIPSTAVSFPRCRRAACGDASAARYNKGCTAEAKPSGSMLLNHARE